MELAKQSERKSQRYQEIKRVLWTVMLLNYAVCLAKLAVGFLAKSSSMVADGFHSLSDGSSNIVGLVGMNAASKPADDDHPYGHGKYETLASLAIAGMLFFVALQVAKATWERFSNPVVPTVGVLQFAVMLGTMAVNALVTRYERRQGHRLLSEVLLSDAAHTMTDLYVSLSVLVSLVAIKLGYPMVDLVASIVIAVLIVKAGLEIVIESSKVITDAAVVPVDEVRAAVLEIDGVIECHDIRSRGRAGEAYVDLHVHVEDQMDLDEVHELSHAISEHLQARFPNIAETSVHVEPMLHG